MVDYFQNNFDEPHFLVIFLNIFDFKCLYNHIKHFLYLVMISSVILDVYIDPLS